MGPENQVFFCDSDSKCMSWLTSHQIFQTILQKCGPLSALTVRVFEYTFPVIGSLLNARCFPESAVSHVLTSSAPRKAQKRKNCSLPFGLTFQKPKRRRIVGAAKSKASRSSSALQDEKSTGTSSLMDTLLSNFGHQSEFNDNISDTSSSSSRGTSSSDFDSEGEELPADPLRKEEEKQTRRVLEEHAELESHPEATAGPSSKDVPVASLHRGKTQCNSHIGIVEISFQVHGRLAVCRECNDKIEKKSVRIGYAYNLKKFHSYTHLSCFRKYLSKQKGDPEQARNFIFSWPQSHQEIDQEARRQLSVLTRQL